MSERKGTKALELWCKRLVKDCPNIQIENMTTSWRNGMAFCALVHHFRPDLIDMSMLKPENIYENNQLAFSVAEKHLGIPSLLDPEDMVENEVPDRLSVLTYLSQFYQRLGHTVAMKVTDNTDSNSTSSMSSPTTTAADIKFGKTALDKCAACDMPVYLAQRLIVSHKLYHRRCFRCSKCSGHLNPKNYHINGSEYYCDSCKNDANLSRLLNNNNDQMGMLAFTDLKSDNETENQSEETIKPNLRPRPKSILERINMFENNINVENIEYKVGSLSINDSAVKSSSHIKESIENNIQLSNSKEKLSKNNSLEMEETNINSAISEKTYKSNVSKLNFLQTQLTSDLEVKEDLLKSEPIKYCDPKPENVVSKNGLSPAIQGVCNVTDDVRLASSQKGMPTDEALPLDTANNKTAEPEKKELTVPPRRKKVQVSADNQNISSESTEKPTKMVHQDDYPEELNPFPDEEEDAKVKVPKRESTNPFGSSEEEDDDVPPIPSPIASTSHQATPVRRHITAYNPFWSDGEEPTSDEEENQDTRSKMYKSPITTSTPNLPGTQKRKKTRAPAPPPPVLLVQGSELPATSMDDVASISSYSSYNSTAHSDYKSSKLTPRSRKKRPAPTPPDSLSTMSNHGGSMDLGMDSSGQRSITDSAKKKGPAPGLPLPERREVKLQITPEELQVQLDLLETQQLGLERQGVLIEQMIRDKCEGDEPLVVPQEEVEDLVIQLCELVNEKNDLFRKQTELMYIRRQQRLEQEQADIEHEIRVIHSRPAVNRIDADKVREEQLVNRLVEIVRMRDELVQQLDAERRRERQEDLAIAASIANKRAQRNSESNSSTMQSMEALVTPKKNKVKDKVKKQLKKAKNSFVSKKKDEDKTEKEKKIKP